MPIEAEMTVPKMVERGDELNGGASWPRVLSLQQFRSHSALPSLARLS
jgi:hypothetical protein